VAALRVQKDRQTFERVTAGEMWQEGGFVFTSTVGTPLNPSNVDKRLKSLLAEAGLPRQRFHDLRHCAASLLLAGGVAPRTIMGILGHSQISLTMNTYAHLSPALERDAANALEAVLDMKGA
jgi:integrase